MNGKPVVRFDGSNDALDVVGTVLASGDVFTVSLVCRLTDAGLGTFHALMLKGSSADQKLYLLGSNSASELWRWSTLDSTFAFTSNTWAIVSYVHAATDDTHATESFFVNTLAKGTRTGTVPAFQSGVLNIGYAAGNFTWYGDIPEIIIWRGTSSGATSNPITRTSTDYDKSDVQGAH